MNFYVGESPFFPSRQIYTRCLRSTMGGKTTKMFKSSNQQQQPSSRAQEDGRDEDRARYRDRPPGHHDARRPDEPSVVSSSASPFVRYRRGSMYVDEDGDMAHEFYVETKEGTNLTLKQISNKNLTPQGDVLLDVPCIRYDYPVVLLDQSKLKE